MERIKTPKALLNMFIRIFCNGLYNVFMEIKTKKPKPKKISFYFVNYCLIPLPKITQVHNLPKRSGKAMLKPPIAIRKLKKAL